jgi:hypothetical protein
MKVHTEQFNNIRDFVETIDTRPLTPNMHGQNSSEGSGWSDPKWYGTENFAEARHLLTYGWDKPAEQIKAAMATIDKLDTTQAMNKTQVRYNVVGSSPCVPRAILGIPESMYEMYRNPQKHRTVALLFGISASASESAETLIKNGVALLQIVYRLEKLGFKVRLDVFESAYSGSNCWGWRLPIKDYKQPLDLLKVCFPIAHPSMLRRFSFKWLETAPNLPEGFSSGYGTPIHHSSSAKKEFEAGQEDNAHVIYSKDCSDLKYDIDKIMSRCGLNAMIDRNSLKIDTLEA